MSLRRSLRIHSGSKAVRRKRETEIREYRRWTSELPYEAA